MRRRPGCHAQLKFWFYGKERGYKNGKKIGKNEGPFFPLQALTSIRRLKKNRVYFEIYNILGA